MKSNNTQAKKEDIPQIVELLINEIDYVYVKIFPGTNSQKRKSLLSRMLLLNDKNNFLNYKRFHCAKNNNDKIIGITGLITTEKVNVFSRIVFTIRVIVTLVKSLTLSQFFKFIISLMKNSDLFSSDIKDSGYITYIIVKDEYQNKGVGTLLLNLSIDHFRQKNNKEISLVVRSKNEKAFSFFRKHGFHEIKRKSDSFIKQGEKVIMTRKI